VYSVAPHQPGDDAGPDAACCSLCTAVRAAQALRQPARWTLRTLFDGAEPRGVELHAEPYGCPTVDPIGRGRGIGGGAVLRNLELAVAELGGTPVVRLLPDAGNPLHIATVTAGDGGWPDPTTGRAPQPSPIRALPRRRDHPRPVAAYPVDAAVCRRLHDAASGDGVRALLMNEGQVRTIGTVLAAAVARRRSGEDDLADVEQWLTDAHRSLLGDRAMITEELRRGTLILLTTETDRPLGWLHAGWALQNAWHTAVGSGLVASAVGGVLDAPGVRAALAMRLRLDGCPQLLLRAGWPNQIKPAA
jgi:hypothetical protein